MKTKIAILISLAVIATIIDWFVVHSGLAVGWYIIGGWFIVWLVCLWLMKSFLLSVACVFGLSMTEDFLYLCASTVFEGRPFYPLYCHDWIPDVIGKWATPMSYDWFGIPSAYYISVLAIVLIKGLTFITRHDTLKSNGGEL